MVPWFRENAGFPGIRTRVPGSEFLNGCVALWGVASGYPGLGSLRRTWCIYFFVFLSTLKKYFENRKAVREAVGVRSCSRIRCRVWAIPNPERSREPGRPVCLRGHVVSRYYKPMTPNEPKRVRRVILTMSCPPQLADRLDALVRETGRSGSEILRSALAAYLQGASSGAST